MGDRGWSSPASSGPPYAGRRLQPHPSSGFRERHEDHPMPSRRHPQQGQELQQQGWRGEQDRAAYPRQQAGYSGSHDPHQNKQQRWHQESDRQGYHSPTWQGHKPASDDYPQAPVHYQHHSPYDHPQRQPWDDRSRHDRRPQYNDPPQAQAWDERPRHDRHQPQYNDPPQAQAWDERPRHDRHQPLYNNPPQAQAWDERPRHDRHQPQYNNPPQAQAWDERPRHDRQPLYNNDDRYRYHQHTDDGRRHHQPSRYDQPYRNHDHHHSQYDSRPLTHQNVPRHELYQGNGRVSSEHQRRAREPTGLAPLPTQHYNRRSPRHHDPHQHNDNDRRQHTTTASRHASTAADPASRHLNSPQIEPTTKQLSHSGGQNDRGDGRHEGSVDSQNNRNPHHHSKPNKWSSKSFNPVRPDPAKGFAPTTITTKLDQLPPHMPSLLAQQLTESKATAPQKAPAVAISPTSAEVPQQTGTHSSHKPKQTSPAQDTQSDPAHATTTTNSPAKDTQSDAAQPITTTNSPATDAPTADAPTAMDAASARLHLPVLLFDLNGTLTSHTASRKSSGITRVRPGMEALARLAHKCRVGIFSSATHRTVADARQLIEEATGGQALFEPGLILHRDHTVSTPHAAGKAWDTAKPLSKWFSSLERVLLFDDDEHKSLADERGNLVLVPDWQEEDEGCKVLEEMANVLEEVLDRLQPGEDIRPHVTTITSRLKAVAEERAKEKGQTTASTTVAQPQVSGQDTPTVIITGQKRSCELLTGPDPNEVSLDDDDV